MNPRFVAIKVLEQVIAHGKSLNHCSSQINEQIPDAKDRALARELVFGVLRYYPTLTFILQRLLQKPLKPKDTDVTCLLLIGIYQLRYMRIPDHAAVNESVKLTQNLKKKWARGFANGVLRNCLREKNTFDELCEKNDPARYSHPKWLLNRIKQDWPDHWESIVEKNNQQAPMILRVNQQQCSVEDYRQKLTAINIDAELMPHAPDALRLLHACDVGVLPGFYDGLVSVQDAAAQQAVANLGLLEMGLKEKCRVLDACAAPGGKTAHILEMRPTADVQALELSEKRLPLIEETLTRLKLKAKVICADAVNVDEWWDGQLFDRILLDAPCSATGVIRRNPDIKFHRRPEDIDAVVLSQKALFDALWPLLKPGGTFLYATCSILKDENENQVQQFLARHDDAIETKLSAIGEVQCQVGVQIFPGHHDMDGFYYARINKKEKVIQ